MAGLGAVGAYLRFSIYKAHEGSEWDWTTRERCPKGEEAMRCRRINLRFRGIRARSAGYAMQGHRW